MDPTADTRPIPFEIDRARNEGLPYHCVSSAKLAILSVASLGIYELVWFYKNWERVRARTGHNISPLGRAIFAPLFCYSLAKTVDGSAESVGVPYKTAAAPIALAYAALMMGAELPDPYWLAGFFTFVPLLPIASQIRRTHEAMRPGFDSAVGWGRGSIATVLLMSPVSLLAIAGAFSPPTRVLRTDEIPASYLETLADEGIIAPGQRVQYFYSAGFLSILEDGNLMTDEGVVSYATYEDELYLSASAFGEIRDFQVDRSEGLFEDTVVTIVPEDGDPYDLLVSAEEGRDEEFVTELRLKVGRARVESGRATEFQVD